MTGFPLIQTPAAAAAEIRDTWSAHSRLGDRSLHGLNGHSSLRVQGIAPCYTWGGAGLNSCFFLFRATHLSDIFLKLLVRAECSFLSFQGAASDKGRGGICAWLLRGWDDCWECRRAGSCPVGALVPTWAEGQSLARGSGSPHLLWQGQPDSGADFSSCCCASRELKAPEGLFIESAFESLLQHR